MKKSLFFKNLIWILPNASGSLIFFYNFLRLFS